MKHRGRDGSGILVHSGTDAKIAYSSNGQLSENCVPGLESISKGAILGHARLAIIDLSDAGLQPMASSNRDVWISFNGEIYNYIELREELRELGHSFFTASDTEVLLAAYNQWGIEALPRLNGMFAFAISDSRNKTLFCARDRFGEKPLYYLAGREQFMFASEIKGLLAGGASRRANAEVVVNYLVHGWTDYSESTFFDGVKQLPAGKFMVVHWDSPYQPTIQSYRDFTSPISVSSTNPMGQFLGALQSSVQLRLRSDVSIGTCLSGGLDSTAIASIAMRQSLQGSGPFHAFTAVPDMKEMSELKWATIAIAGKNATLHQVPVSRFDLAQQFEDFIHAQDEPVPSMSMYMQFKVMRAARDNGIKVLLDGQGGDEVLLGYDRLIAAYIRQMIHYGEFAKASHAIFRYTEVTGISPFRFLGLMLFMSPFARKARRRRNKNSFWLNSDVREFVTIDDGLKSGIRNVQDFELEVIPLPGLLRFEDRNAMWHGIETRLPFLDPSLVEFCLNCETDLKFRDGWTKWILRKSMEGLVPPEILWRRTKGGFDAPTKFWLEEIFKSDFLKELCSMKASKFVHKSKSSLEWASELKLSDPLISWRILCLEVWMQLYDVQE